MARYRKIDVRIWSDERFRRLSPAKPNAQTLWFFLLTNRFTTNIPGLYSAGEAALAEEMGWPLAGFRKAFAEIYREGMAEADWIARVVWVPKAIRYHEPESPNVIKGWRVAFDEIPDCALKGKAVAFMGAFAQTLPEGFAKAFLEAFANGSGESFRQPLPNQKQKQKQKQDLNNDRPVASAPAPDVVSPLSTAALESEWDPALVRKVHDAAASTRKSGHMADGPWRSFLLSAQQFTKEIRERAAREYLDRAYASDRKDERYLLGIMRGENGRTNGALRGNGATQLHVDNDALNAEPPGRKFL